jgi:iron(III) transport system ATP-binding protein
MSHLELVEVEKAYGDGHGGQVVLAGVDLTVDAQSMTAILGPSGSGKTTLLRLVAGFDRVDRGQIRIGGTTVDDGRRAQPPERRRLGYVPQEGALFPHLNVAANVAFGLAHRRRQRARVAELLDLVGLSGLERRYPDQLSGGQQQRVALARALATEPSLVLLDEPFSALDASLRAALRVEVRDILRQAGATTVLVTHDQDEALSLADQVAVLRRGRVVQHGPPHQVYAHPVDAELARFLGEANLVDATVVGDVATTALGRLPVLAGTGSGQGARSVGDSVQGAAQAMVRPEQLVLETVASSPGPSTGPSPEEGQPAVAGAATGHVVGAEFHGHFTLVTVRLDGAEGVELVARHEDLVSPEPGSAVAVSVRGPVVAWADPAREGVQPVEEDQPGEVSGGQPGPDRPTR